MCCNVREESSKGDRCMRHYSLVIHYLVDADVLLFRLDHPYTLFAHLVYYAKYVDRVHIRYLKSEQN